MVSPVVLFGLLSTIYFVARYLNRTDTPKIKNLPEIPGVPIFGNLLQLGSTHAKVAKGWAKQYGPVFQTRLGNKVGRINLMTELSDLTHVRESYLPILSRP